MGFKGTVYKGLFLSLIIAVSALTFLDIDFCYLMDTVSKKSIVCSQNNHSEFGIESSSYTYTSKNPTQHVAIEFCDYSFSLQSLDKNTWKNTIELQSIHKGAISLKISDNPHVNINDSLMNISNEHFTIEYINSKQGLRQNFIVHSQPMGDSTLTVELKTQSDELKPLLMNNDGIAFIDKHSSEIVITYKDLKVWDANNTLLDASFSLHNNTIALHIDDKQAVYPITIDPLSATPDWSMDGNQFEAFFGYVLTPLGDINGDDIGDFAAGMPKYDIAKTDEGAVFVFLGSVNGPEKQPQIVLSSGQANSEFGFSVAGIGDINKDGYDDIMVGAPRYDNGQLDEGAAFLYLGSSSGIISTPAMMKESNQANARFGYAISSAGKANNDDTLDIAISAPYYDNGSLDEGAVFVYFGGNGSLANTSPWMVESNQIDARMGISISGGMDINGDSKSDLLIGIPFYDNGHINEGCVRVYFSSTNGLSTNAAWQFESNQANAECGTSVALCSDLNGDGFNDVLIGAPFYSNGEQSEGRAYCFYGTSNGLSTNPAWTNESNQANARYGQSVACAGDVNNDGNADFIIGAPLYDNGQLDEGKAYLYFGNTASISQNAGWTSEGNQADAQFGTSVSGLGDINFDTKSDFGIGAPYYDDDLREEGQVSIYYGISSSLSSSDKVLETDIPLAQLGASLAPAGDINGDGYDDMIAGSPDYENGEQSEGRIQVYLGSASGFSSTPSWIYESNSMNARMGASVASAGDINGDGYSDILVGAPGYSNGQNAEGKLMIFLGSAQGISSSSPFWQYESNQSAANLGASVASAGDINNDGFSDILVGAPGASNSNGNVGMVMLFSGNPIGPDSILWTSYGPNSGCRFGATIASADINADTYNDIFIGAPSYNSDSDIAPEGGVFCYFGRKTKPSDTVNWRYSISNDNSELGYAIANIGDVNMDGFTDIAIGAPSFSNGQNNEGVINVFYGNTQGLSLIPSWYTESNTNGSKLGTSLSGYGDFNADGISDMIAGCPGFSSGQNQEGAVFTYYGSQTGLSTGKLFSESDQAGAKLGTSIGICGDINGDGISDICAGAPYYKNGQLQEGAITVSYGKQIFFAISPNQVIEAAQDNEEYGWTVSGRADFNGDGFGDFAVGSPFYDGISADQGRVTIHYGSASGIDIVAKNELIGPNQNGAGFGYAIAANGDLNGDGFADLIVSAPFFDDANSSQQDIGRIYVYYGSKTGLELKAKTVFSGSQAGGKFGFSLCYAGDINLDGYSDIVLGEPGFSSTIENAGKANVMFGSEYGLNTNNYWSKIGPQTGSEFGASVASAGDINGDGINDIIIGAPSYDVNSAQDDQGRVYIHYGIPNGIADSAGWIVSGNQYKALFGANVASAGDINNDGFSDVLIASTLYDKGQTNEGIIQLFLGSAKGASKQSIWTAEGDITALEFGKSAGSIGDINNDGYGDIVVGSGLYSSQANAHRSRLYLGSSNGLSALPVWTYKSSGIQETAGACIAPIADINGDGYPDLAVSTRSYDSGFNPKNGMVAIFYGNGNTGSKGSTLQYKKGTNSPITTSLRVENSSSVDIGASYFPFTGRTFIRPIIEVKPLNQAFNNKNTVTSSTWTDIQGLKDIVQNISALTVNSSYKWRMRFEYKLAEGNTQHFSRWFCNNYNTPGEIDFRTGAACNTKFGYAPDIVLCESSGKEIGNIVSGGLPPYQYSWEPVTGLSSVSIARPLANPAKTTTYICTVIDGSFCVVKDTINVIVNPALSTELPDSFIICEGDSIQLPLIIKGGTPPYKYKWTPSSGGLSSLIEQVPIARPNATTLFKIEIKDALQCTIYDSITVKVNKRPYQPIIDKINDSTLTCITDAITYQWYKDSVLIQGATSRTLTYTQRNGTGNYVVEIGDINSCKNQSFGFRVATSLQDWTTKKSFIIYPNPASDIITLSLQHYTSVQGILSITSVLGQNMISIPFATNDNGIYKHQLNLSSLPTGIYYVRLKSGNLEWTEVISLK